MADRALRHFSPSSDGGSASMTGRFVVHRHFTRWQVVDQATDRRAGRLHNTREHAERDAARRNTPSDDQQEQA